MYKSGADPGLVVGGGANPLEGDTDPIYFIHFLINPMKLKKFWSVRWGRVKKIQTCLSDGKALV